MLIKICKHLLEVVNNQPQVLQQLQLQHRVTYSPAMGFGVMSMVLLLLPFDCVNAVGYSYTRFIGPVAGPERKILVNDGNTQLHGSDAQRFDYVAKPEYEFAYGVEDADAHILHNRNEMRDGDAVKGVYSLIDPDGTLRVVKYTADEMNGFQAEVIRNGVSSLHGQLQHDYMHAPPSKTTYNNHYNANYNTPSQAPPAHFKGDRIMDYPSSNTHKSNVVQLSHKRYETPQQQPIIYHYNQSYDDDDESGDRDGDYNGRSNEREDQQPHYEVSENQDQRPQYEVHERPDEDTQQNQDDDDDLGYKSHNHAQFSSYKKKKQHLDNDDDDDDDDEDYDDVDDSEEMDDYDDTVHVTHNSEESYEYY